MPEWLTLSRISFLVFIPAFIGFIYCLSHAYGCLRPEKRTFINFIPFVLLLPTNLYQQEGKRWLLKAYGLAVVCVGLLVVIYQFSEKAS